MAAADETPAEVEELGRQPFAQVHRQMLARAAAVHRGEQPGVVWLLEHDPVYTAGRATPRGELEGDTVAIERGGRITWHGPGQLVVYPIVRLPRRDVRWWLRRLETFGVAMCAAFGLEATASRDGTGVFVGARKVASIGVAVRHWVNLHGLALNVAVDLAPFSHIRPCGLDPEVMTDLSRLLGRAVPMSEAIAAARDLVFLLATDLDPR